MWCTHHRLSNDTTMFKFFIIISFLATNHVWFFKYKEIFVKYINNSLYELPFFFLLAISNTAMLLFFLWGVYNVQL